MKTYSHIEKILNKQKEDFLTNQISVAERIRYLQTLKSNILMFENDIYSALKLELGKTPEESYMSEISLILKELDYFIKNLKSIAKPKTVFNKFPFWFSSQNKIMYQPYGTVLLISPFNYPFQLLFLPLIGAIAAGNRVFVKISPLSFKSRFVIEKILSNTFSEEIVFFAHNKKENLDDLLNLDFDFVFFTGSTQTGKLISSKFSPKFTPMVLEMGGKCPVIIDVDVDLHLTVKRLLWGKFLNVGQTCIAADYVIVNALIYQDFIDELIKQLRLNFTNTLNNDSFGKIIDSTNFNRLTSMLSGQKILYGGKYNANSIKIEPTIVEVKDMNNILMIEEIFGPILPIIKYTKPIDIINIIDHNPSPLSIYVFTNNDDLANYIYNQTKSGSFVLNDVLFQITKRLPFGGINNSGIGNYHFLWSFKCFTQERPYVKTSKLNHEIRFNPYSVDFKKLKSIV